MGLRSFVAVELPEEIKRKIADETSPLRRSGADVSWVPAENLHVTLKFLGNIREQDVPVISASLHGVASAHGVFELTVRGAGAFPPKGRPRVVWAGLPGAQGLIRLQGDVQAAMAALGFESDKRPYSAHITLGRVKSSRGGHALADGLVALDETLFGKIRVEGLSLMKSELSSAGAEYSRLKEFPLGK